MNKNYTSIQRKTYSDYSDYSTDSLAEMLKSKKLVHSVTEIIEDILVDRNVISKKDLHEKTIQQKNELIKSKRNEKEKFNKIEQEKLQKDILFFVEKFRNSTDNNIAEIISKYEGYQLAIVEAALIISEQRGTISNAEKEELRIQIINSISSKDIEFKAVDHAKNEDAKKDMLYGTLWCVGGIIATSANLGYIFWGAIVFGGIQFIKGVANSQ